MLLLCVFVFVSNPERELFVVLTDPRLVLPDLYLLHGAATSRHLRPRLSPACESADVARDHLQSGPHHPHDSGFPKSSSHYGQNGIHSEGCQRILKTPLYPKPLGQNFHKAPSRLVYLVYTKGLTDCYVLSCSAVISSGEP